MPCPVRHAGSGRARRAGCDPAEIGTAGSGLGVPEGVGDRLFDPFFTNRRVGEGIGQVLSIARNVIGDQHGGELSLADQVGIGTGFVVNGG